VSKRVIDAPSPRIVAIVGSWSLTTAVLMPARASEPVRFEYSAPAECPGKAQFIERVRERSQYGRLASDDEPARTFVVALTVDESGATARVDFVDADGSPAFRNVEGTTCEEAVSGMALVCALAIDGRATPEESAAPKEPAVEVPAPLSPSHAPTTVLVESTPATKPVDRAEPAARASASKTSFSAGVGAAYSSHRGPSGAPVIDAFFGGRLSDLGPSARASGWYFRSDATSSSGREARFRGYGFRLEACPLAFGKRSLFAEPCIATDAGWIRASGVPGEALVETHDSTGGLWDVLAIARLGAVVSGRLLLEAQGELAVPLLRHQYGFGEPPAEPLVYEVPAVGVSIGASIGFLFP
jgi:hypothetical protein